MENIREKLEDAAQQAFEDFAHSTPGSGEYEAARKAVETISRLKIEEYKAEAEVTSKDEDQRITEKKNTAELELKEKQAKRERLQGWLGIGTTVGSLILYGWGLSRITKFEENGVITSKTFNLLPKPLNLFKK